MDYFDLTNGHGTLATALEKTQARFLVISFSSDWLYPSYQSQELVRALRSRNRDVAYVELQSNYGHGFLPGGRGGADRPGARFPGQHVRESAMKAGFVRELLGRSDYAIIGEIVEPKTKVLDLGCGEGELLEWLASTKGVDARGVEISGAKVQKAIARGVSVFQCDIDEGLTDYPDQAFDYVILSQTLQETRHPRKVLREMLRVGRRAIVAFPNFGHWQMRMSMLFSGRVPRTSLFPYEWYESPNIHILTVHDFEALAALESLAQVRHETA
jgi:homoserine O-acetyltransferase